MAVRCDAAISNVVACVVDKFVLLTGMVAHVQVAKVRDVGTDEVQLEKVLVRETVSYVGNRLADLQEVQATKSLRKAQAVIRAHIATKRAELAGLQEQARIELSSQ